MPEQVNTFNYLGCILSYEGEKALRLGARSRVVRGVGIRRGAGWWLGS
jgi:hypothetical protein